MGVRSQRRPGRSSRQRATKLLRWRRAQVESRLYVACEANLPDQLSKLNYGSNRSPLLFVNALSVGVRNFIFSLCSIVDLRRQALAPYLLEYESQATKQGNRGSD